MPGNLLRDERTYRRGFVMGLTLAEILILMVFVLLLILAWSAVDYETKTRVERLTERLRDELDVDVAAGEATFDDHFRTLVLDARLGRDVGRLLADIDTTKGAGEGSGGLTEKALALMKAGAAATALGTNRMGLATPSAAAEFIDTARRAYEKAAQDGGHGSARVWLDDVIKRAETAGGGGTDHPPCSSTNGTPDYIFDVTLRSNTITVTDNMLPHLAERRHDWPLDSIDFDQDVTASRFLSMTAPLFRWSNDRRCRFFVLIIDDTAQHEKMRYKLQLRTVGQHFYYYEPLSNVNGR